MNLKLPTLTCLRCGYSWFPRSTQLPKVCPNRKCKSPYWNRKRRTLKQNAASQALTVNWRARAPAGDGIQSESMTIAVCLSSYLYSCVGGSLVVCVFLVSKALVMKLEPPSSPMGGTSSRMSSRRRRACMSGMVVWCRRWPHASN